MEFISSCKCNTLMQFGDYVLARAPTAYAPPLPLPAPTSLIPQAVCLQAMPMYVCRSPNLSVSSFSRSFSPLSVSFPHSYFPAAHHPHRPSIILHPCLTRGAATPSPVVRIKGAVCCVKPPCSTGELAHNGTAQGTRIHFTSR
jgi:hypothetical protein